MILAMNEELSPLHKTGTWDLVHLPPGKHAPGCRWVYKIKTKSDGSLERYKARLTFAPVAKMTSVRTLLVVASAHQWNLSQMDVKNAFLNGDLFKEVCMVPPPAPRAWFEKFSADIGSLGFQSNSHDPALFVRSTFIGRILLLLYVVDMILTNDDLDGITQLKLALHDQFQKAHITNTPFELNVRYTPSDGTPLDC
ncbi:transposable element gene [Prunus dulcis]|uniref:Transposable element protein n=1 Tax=Prunus dulcis TaxID=3755 RepID=A0A4Y1RSD5_PRUDU|nr:transposable element gene [Prunus dulcis]